MRKPYVDLGVFWQTLWTKPWLRGELQQLLVLLQDRRRHCPKALPGALAKIPLRVHGTYARDEVFAAFDERSKNGKLKRTQGGIYNVKAHRIELLFVELEKSERDYSPTTLYNDYPITPRSFHWESQSSAHEGTPAGQRYIAATKHTAQNVLLLVRPMRHDARGQTMPYLCLGLCDYAGHTGRKPMRIDWALRVAMPAWFFQQTKGAGG